MLKPLKKYNLIISLLQEAKTLVTMRLEHVLNDECHILLAKAGNNTAVNLVVKICF